MKGSSLRILVLTKRQYMGKDLLDDRFGRFRELPLELARLGHEVQGLSLSYRPRPTGSIIDSGPSRDGQVLWHSLNLANGFLPALRGYFKQARQLLQDFRPNIIWSCSDAYHAIFGYRLIREGGAKYVIDLYDNFEAFPATKLPTVLRLFKRAVRGADGVTCFSERLARHVMHTYPRSKPTTVIENGVRRAFFAIRNQQECRRQLRLPEDVRIIGTAGALDGSRAIDTLFEAFNLLSRQSNDLHLVLAGPRERSLRIPTGARVHDLGILPHQEVPCFINALDLAVICYRQSAQGEFSFPQKAYEIMACRVPLIAAAVGSMNELLSGYPTCLYEPENPQSLAEAALLQLENRITIETAVPSWTDSAKRLEYFFEKMMQVETSNTRTQLIAELAR
jgi:teichuronic acid biosynthesis glycosyltransferase TuaC